MPSNIRPKDFERYLPEEKDTLAQGLVKYIQFAILFWRWFRSEFKADGTFGRNIKTEMCASGCLEKNIVKPDSENNEEEDQEDNESEEETLPGPVIPKADPNPSTPDASDCCKKIEGYETFEFYQATKVDLGCDLNNNKFIGINGSINLSSNDNWSAAAAIYNFRQNSGGTKGKPSNDFGLPSGQEQMYTEQVGIWPRVEVIIYGHCSDLDFGSGGISPEGTVAGYFQKNPNSGGSGNAKIPFNIGNGGNFCVSLFIPQWESDTTSVEGSAYKSFKIHIDDIVPQEFREGQPQMRWRSKGDKPYLFKVYGIRMVVLGYNNVYVANDKPAPVGVENGIPVDYLVYDERWQNEKPCFVPPNAGTRAKHLAPAFTWDGSTHTIGQIYPHSTVNDLEITFRNFNLGQ